ncbi:MAG TPA: SMC-Scp complex subunit ScpB [Acidobacteriaceae bacterium]|jgi:segregation and condensation protein B|nr:SMC-Scp complex subunit ScpB [Acidobacteriaceae bacterium]
MSLKAKIEAVIYAAEEPVTLAQLTGLLGEEAQAELDALAARQESLALEESADPEPNPEALNAETLGEAPESAHQSVISTGAADPGSPASSLAGVEEPRSGETPVFPADAAGTAESAQDAEVTPAAKPAPDASSDAQAATRARERRLRDHFRSLLDELIADYATSDRGLEIREVAGGFRLATKPEYHDAVRGFVKSLKPPLKLSLQALETLAVIAYKQPVTAPEVSEIRSVDSTGVLGSLMARKLIATAGRKQVIGRPILYKTTREFLVRFGLKDLNELPSIEEFEKMAGEFADAVQEEIPMAEQASARRSEEDATANFHQSQADGEPYSEENLSGEDPSAVPDNPADEVLADGRLSGVPPNYDREEYLEDHEGDTPAIDAEVQGNEKTGGA